MCKVASSKMAFSGSSMFHQEPRGISTTRSLPSHHLGLTRRLVHYEKDFNINLTRVQSSPAVAAKDPKNSMLAYSENMRAINARRFPRSYGKSDADSNAIMLQVQARHIPKSKVLPKLTTPTTNGSPKSAVFGLNGSGPTVLHGDIGTTRINRSHTIPPLTPSASPSKASRNKEELRLNFASASDLQEIAHPGKQRGSSPYQLRDSGLHRGRAWESESHSPLKSKEAKQISFEISVEPIAEHGPTGGDKSFNKQIAPLAGDSLSTISNKDCESISEEDQNRLEREKVTKELLRSALEKLKEVESRTKSTPLTLPKLKKSKRLRFPKKNLDCIPEDEAEYSSEYGSRPSSMNRLHVRHSFPPARSRERSLILSTPHLDTIHERDNKLQSPTKSVLDGHSRVYFQNHVDQYGGDMTMDNDEVQTAILQDKNKGFLPNIVAKHEQEMHWRVLGGSDALKSKKLQLRAKQRQKPRRMKYPTE